jgi:hypothetical protein
MTDNDDLDKLAIEAMNDLFTMFDYPDRETGDVDISQLIAAWRCVRSTVESRMEKLISEGTWQGLYVRGGNGQRVYIYRKVKMAEQ